jgi:hypothetical protein
MAWLNGAVDMQHALLSGEGVHDELRAAAGRALAANKPGPNGEHVPASTAQDALDFLASWATTLDQAETAQAPDQA